MECSCGGFTREHTVQKKKKTIGEYKQCTSCGRILWTLRTPELERDLEKERQAELSATEKINE